MLQPLKEKILHAVERAIHDAMPDFIADFDSVIMSESERACLGTLCFADPRSSLLYRASRDGWEGKNFHSKCDNKGPTLTVIKCTGGYVFGGYANAAWTSNENGSYQASPGSFLFSLVSPSGMGPVKMMLKNISNALRFWISNALRFWIRPALWPRA